MSEPILSVENLTVDFFGRARDEVVRAVDGISLEVQPGEVLALVGESGCGKTTTANAVLGLTRPSGGRVVVSGTDIAHADRKAMKTARAKMQMIAQDPYESLNPRMTIADIVVEPLVVHGMLNGDGRSRAIDALELAGLVPGDDYIHRSPHELSGGQRQRVVIAAALSIEPKLIIADEPVSMLDVSVRAGILNLLRRLAEDEDIAILMITHDLATVAAYSHRIAVMYLGAIVETGPTLDVVRDPQHPYTRALLSVVPNHDPAARSRPILLEGETPDASIVPRGCRFHPRCPVAMDRCADEEPSPFAVTDQHSAACLLLG